jgi:hypothetical protein
MPSPQSNPEPLLVAATRVERWLRRLWPDDLDHDIKCDLAATPHHPTRSELRAAGASSCEDYYLLINPCPRCEANEILEPLRLAIAIERNRRTDDDS